MISIAIAYSVTYMGPWASLKDWANITESRNWQGFVIYASSLRALAMVVFPGAYVARSVWLGLGGHRRCPITGVA